MTATVDAATAATAITSAAGSGTTAPVASAPAVRLTGIGKTFRDGGAPVLDGIDLDVAPGEFVCLLGASGCGKSTLLNIVAGLDAPSQGSVQVPSGRAALMFQEAALFPWLTAGENIDLALRLRGQIGRAHVCTPV